MALERRHANTRRESPTVTHLACEYNTIPGTSSSVSVSDCDCKQGPAGHHRQLARSSRKTVVKWTRQQAALHDHKLVTAVRWTRQQAALHNHKLVTTVKWTRQQAALHYHKLVTAVNWTRQQVALHNHKLVTAVKWPRQ